ncbi:MAG: Rpn family recombination-promoting nuclease/putative transposase [Lachnospiraceae bacterium]|nr:Rpn family recombination-promoting nuclease/putative transposase [Lachnospiraceae bacterium]
MEQNKPKPLSELNLIDNFLFEEMLNDPETGPILAKVLLTAIFDKEFKNIQIIPQRHVSGTQPDKHGICLDAYIDAIETSSENPFENVAVEIQSNIYDIEPNKYRATNEAKRTRYYHSLIDSKILKSGTDYHLLKNVAVIMITPYDPFGENRMVYTFKTSCVESPSLPYNDGITTIFLYTKGIKGNPSQSLVNVLQYIENTDEKNAINSALRNIQHGVTRIKNDGEVGVRYMKYWEIKENARQEGHKAGLAEGHKAGLAEGHKAGLAEGHKTGVLEVAKNLLDILDPATIAQKTGLSEEEILTLAENQ